MPDRRVHRGLHPKDAELFGAPHVQQLRAATFELSWLLERGYQLHSALKLTGDRHALTARQRAAVSRCACPESRAKERMQRMLPAGELAGATLAIDGFNVLTTLEVALSGGVVLIGRDGVMRDIAGVHGSYRRVEETEPALQHLRHTLDALGIRRCEWLLDAPVSNSGRLCVALRELAATHGLDWDARLLPDPDVVLANSAVPVASADGEILDSAARSCNLARLCVERTMPDAFVLELGLP